MGMGFFANVGYVIELEKLREIVPKEVGLVEAAMESYDMGWDNFANNERHEEESPAIVTERWEHLQEAFKAATEEDGYCLEVEIDYHDADSGDRYDEIDDGCVFLVDGMEQLTPAGKRFEGYIPLKRWVVFG